MPPADWLIATWNVNSVRARLDHVLRFLLEYRPEVLCLQETKVQDADFPRAAFTELGYHAAVYGEKQRNGVALLSVAPLSQVLHGFGDGQEAPEEARLMQGVFRGVRIFNAYFPNGTAVGSERFAYKLAFYQRLKRLLSARFRPAEPLLLAGDFNVAPQAIDVYDPAACEGQICYHADEREALADLKSWGFCDLFRQFHQAAEQQYTWWDFRTSAYERGTGLRIDFIWATAGLRARALECWIESAERGREKPSDHAPVLALLRGG